MLYSTQAQESASWARRSMVVTLRTANDPLSLAAAVRPIVRSVDPAVPITDLRTMESVVSSTVAQPRFRTLLLALFAAVALVLAAVGIAAVMAYTVTQRTHEIGVRMALGAQRRDVLRLVIGQGMRPTLLGVALGLVVSFATTRLLAGLLYGVEPTDAPTFLAVALLLSTVALGASSVPAWRASRVDPMVAMRRE
jgi:putative ABC transport system permease protein